MPDSYKKVYSTEDAICRKCGGAVCVCRKTQHSPGGPVRVGRETKGRKGAGVTVVTGLELPETELRKILSALKKRLGCGGTLREGVLEFQGEHRDALLAELSGMGITAKKSGG